MILCVVFNIIIYQCFHKLSLTIIENNTSIFPHDVLEQTFPSFPQIPQTFGTLLRRKGGRELQLLVAHGSASVTRQGAPGQTP